MIDLDDTVDFLARRDPDEIAGLVAYLGERGKPWRDTLGGARVLVAINQEVADFDAPVQEGDEVAFFPPVTGG